MERYMAPQEERRECAGRTQQWRPDYREQAGLAPCVHIVTLFVDNLKPQNEPL